jgi:hypothetical protein
MITDDKAFAEFHRKNENSFLKFIQDVGTRTYKGNAQSRVSELRILVKRAFEAGIKHQERVENERKDALGIERPDGFSE